MTDIDFTSDLERQLYQQARIGIAAQDFLNSPLGRSIRERALDDRQQALEALLEVDPSHEDEISKLQFEARVAIGVLEWLSDAIDEGNQAEQNLDVEEHDRS